LKRMFLSSKTTKDARWHQLKWKPVDNEPSHPADGQAWKHFDESCLWWQVLRMYKCHYIRDVGK
jgi:hypothetical protein